MLKGLISKIFRVEESAEEMERIDEQVDEDLSDELELTVNAVQSSGILDQIIQILGDVNFRYESLNEQISSIKNNLISDDFVSTVRIVRWDGKVITQKGTVISKNSKIIKIDTMTGEYGVEIVLSKKPQDQVKFKLLWIGLDYAGKTTLLHKLRYNEYINPKRTVGQELEDVVIEGLKITNVDLGGQKALRQHWSKFPLIPEVIVYVIDILDEARFDETYEELESKVINNERYDGIPILIIINKIDEYNENQDPIEYITDKIDLFGLLGQRSWQLQVVSALTGEGLDQVVDVLTRFLLDSQTR